MIGTVSKTVVSLRVPRVRIPDSPPLTIMQKLPLNNETLYCDASRPFITQDLLREELALYNISPERLSFLYRDYARITGKEITPDSRITELSGGQKVMLMAMLALYSPASSIRFVDLHISLDSANRELISGIIERFAVEKNIFLDSSK